VLTVDRPEARNALTGAMYFGIRYAIDRVNADPTLAGLLITGIDDVFIPGGDLGGSQIDDWGAPKLLGMDNVPFDAVRYSRKPIVSAVNGICQGGGLLIAIMSDVAVASDHARSSGRRRSTAASPTPATRATCPHRSARRGRRTCSSPAAA
jgi:enoyl-CoA hydratase